MGQVLTSPELGAGDLFPQLDELVVYLLEPFQTICGFDPSRVGG